jgi:hypothetical protein
MFLGTAGIFIEARQRGRKRQRVRKRKLKRGRQAET